MVSVAPDHPLRAPFSKLERARAKTAEFEHIAREYCKTAESDFLEEIKDDGFKHIIIKLKKPLPDDLFHAAAEAAYHLRSSLDQTLVAIATHGGMTRTAHLHYPFVRQKAEFYQPRTQNKMRGLPPDVISLIERTKPWSDADGDQELYGVGSIANVDKHNVFIPVAAPVGGETVISGGTTYSGTKSGAVLFYWDPSQNLLEGMTIAKLGPDGYIRGCEIRMNILFTLGAGAGPFTGQPLVKAFQEMIDLTEGIVQMFSAHSFGQ